MYTLVSERKIKSGAVARQNGENVKNALAPKLSYQEGETMEFSDNKVLKTVIAQLGIDFEKISSISTKALADNGSCSKPDLFCTINYKDNSPKTTPRISLKSTFGGTQVSVHSVASLNKHLINKKIILHQDSIKFLTLFVGFANNYEILPTIKHSESKRRKRFSCDEIREFDENLFQTFKADFKKYAKEIMMFLIAHGEKTKTQEQANYILFCNKSMQDIYVENIEHMVNTALARSEINDSWVVPHKERPNNGSTVLALFDGLIKLQMKGSGKKKDKVTGEIVPSASYHHTQFNISGSFVRKWI